jgi:hypothetical protein
MIGGIDADRIERQPPGWARCRSQVVVIVIGRKPSV